MTDTEIPPVDQDEASSIPAQDKEQKEEIKGGAAKGSARSSAVWMGTAVGIGSAALVAALMYAKRRK